MIDIDREIARKTRRSFLTGGIVSAVGLGAWEWVRSRREDDGVPWPLRAGLRANENLTKDYFNETRLARTFPPSAVQSGRVNGDLGLDAEADPDWKLQVASDGLDAPLSLTLADIQALPKIDMITELKCIEGWTRTLHWGGARFRDFVQKYLPSDTTEGDYVSLETPDGQYYVGLDMQSAMHSQTLLCYEMNGKPLEPQHGAPLRLVIPLKYGVKNLKNIGKISFPRSRPADYWAERGYDWYAGF